MRTCSSRLVTTTRIPACRHGWPATSASILRRASPLYRAGRTAASGASSAWSARHAPKRCSPTIPLFAGLTRKDRELAAQLSTNVTMPAGAVLTREGAQGAEFFVLLDGEVDVVQGGEVIATRGPGSPLGEMALLEGGLRTATLVAKTPVSTLVSGRREFNNLLDAVPHVSERLHAITAERHAA